MNENPPFPFRRGGFDSGPMYLHHHGGPPALAWATFALVLLLVLAVFAMVVARMAAGGRGHRKWHRHVQFAGPGLGGPPDPLRLLAMRYAHGEIDRDAFLQGTSDLTASAPTVEKPPG